MEKKNALALLLIAVVGLFLSHPAVSAVSGYSDVITVTDGDYYVRVQVTSPEETRTIQGHFLAGWKINSGFTPPVVPPKVSERSFTKGALHELTQRNEVQIFPGDWLIWQRGNASLSAEIAHLDSLGGLQPTWVMRMGGTLFTQNTRWESFPFLDLHGSDSPGAAYYFYNLEVKGVSLEEGLTRPTFEDGELVYTISGEPYVKREGLIKGSKGIYLRINNADWHTIQRSPYPSFNAFPVAPVLGTYTQFAIKELVAEATVRQVTMRILAQQFGRMILTDLATMAPSTGAIMSVSFCVVAAPVAYAVWRTCEEVDAKIVWRNIFRFAQWATRNATTLYATFEVTRLTIEKARELGDEGVAGEFTDDLPDISQALHDLEQAATSEIAREALERAREAYRRLQRDYGPQPQKPRSWRLVQALCGLFLAEEIYSLYDPEYAGLLERMGVFGDYAAERAPILDFSRRLTSQEVMRWEEKEISDYVAGLVVETGRLEDFHWEFNEAEDIWEAWFTEFFNSDVTFDGHIVRYLYVWSRVLPDSEGGDNLRLLADELARRRALVEGVDLEFYRELMALMPTWRQETRLSYAPEHLYLTERGSSSFRINNALGIDLARMSIPGTTFGATQAYFVDKIEVSDPRSVDAIKTSFLRKFGLLPQAYQHLRCKIKGRLAFLYLEDVDQSGFLINTLTKEVFYLRGHGNAVTRLALSGFGSVETFVEVSRFDHDYMAAELKRLAELIQRGQAVELEPSLNNGISSTMFQFPEKPGLIVKRFKLGQEWVRGCPVDEFRRACYAYDNDIATPMPYGVVWSSDGDAYFFQEFLDNHVPYNKAIEEGLIGENGIDFSVETEITLERIGLAHGDLRIWNVLVSRTTGKISVIDWGLGTRIDEPAWQVEHNEDIAYFQAIRNMSRLASLGKCVDMPASYWMRSFVEEYIDLRGVEGLESLTYEGLELNTKYPRGKEFVYVVDISVFLSQRHLGFTRAIQNHFGKLYFSRP